MAFLDIFTASSFEKTNGGRYIFFPWGRVGNGLEIPSELKYVKIRRFLNWFVLLSLCTIVLAGNLFGLLLGLLAVIVSMIGYLGFVVFMKKCLAQVSRDAVNVYGVVVSDRRGSMVFCFIAALVFSVSGIIVMAWKGKADVVLLSGVVIFGIIAIIFGFRIRK